jgi:hypothetical protein
MRWFPTRSSLEGPFGSQAALRRLMYRESIGCDLEPSFHPLGCRTLPAQTCAPFPFLP